MSTASDKAASSSYKRHRSNTAVPGNAASIAPGNVAAAIGAPGKGRAKTGVAKGERWRDALQTELFDHACDFLSGRDLLTRVELVCRAWRARSLKGCGWRNQLGQRGCSADGGVWMSSLRHAANSDTAVLGRLGVRVCGARHLRLSGSCDPLLSPAVAGALLRARFRTLSVHGCVRPRGGGGPFGLPTGHGASPRCGRGCAPADVLWAATLSFIGAPDAPAVAAAAVAGSRNEYGHTTGLELRACGCWPHEPEDARYTGWLAQLGPIAYLKLDGVGLSGAALDALAGAPAAAAVRFMVLERMPALRVARPDWLGAFDNLRDLVLVGHATRLECLPPMRHLARLCCNGASFSLAPPSPTESSPWPALRTLDCQLQPYDGAAVGVRAATFVALASACAPTLITVRFHRWPRDVSAQDWATQLTHGFPRLRTLEIFDVGHAWSELRTAVRARAPALQQLSLSGFTGPSSSIVDDLVTGGGARPLEWLALRSTELTNAQVYRLCGAYPQLVSLCIQGGDETFGFLWSAAAAAKLHALAPRLEYLELVYPSETLRRKAVSAEVVALPFHLHVS